MEQYIGMSLQEEADLSQHMHDLMRQHFARFDQDIAKVAQFYTSMLYFVFIVGGYEDIDEFGDLVKEALIHMKETNFITQEVVKQ